MGELLYRNIEKMRQKVAVKSLKNMDDVPGTIHQLASVGLQSPTSPEYRRVYTDTEYKMAHGKNY